MLGAALTFGISPIEVKEIVYEAVPYVGMAKVFDFLHATNDVLTEAVCVTFVRLRAVSMLEIAWVACACDVSHGTLSG
jgi:hypothetical protein